MPINVVDFNSNNAWLKEFCDKSRIGDTLVERNEKDESKPALGFFCYETMTHYRWELKNEWFPVDKSIQEFLNLDSNAILARACLGILKVPPVMSMEELSQVWEYELTTEEASLIALNEVVVPEPTPEELSILKHLPLAQKALAAGLTAEQVSPIMAKAINRIIIAKTQKSIEPEAERDTTKKYVPLAQRNFETTRVTG